MGRPRASTAQPPAPPSRLDDLDRMARLAARIAPPPRPPDQPQGGRRQATNKLMHEGLENHNVSIMPYPPKSCRNTCE